MQSPALGVAAQLAKDPFVAVPGHHVGAVAGQDGRIYTVGLDWGARRVDAYNPVSNTWTTSPPSLLHPQAYPAMGRIGTRIYAAGGNPGSLTITSDTLETLRIT